MYEYRGGSCSGEYRWAGSRGEHVRIQLLVACASLLLTGPAPILAASFTATSTIDAPDADPGDGVCNDGSGACTLRAAVQETNALPTEDEVTIPLGTFVLVNGPLEVTDRLAITGNGPASIIEGDGSQEVVTVFADEAQFRRVTIRGGTTGVECGLLGDPSCHLVFESSVVTEHTGAAVHIAYGDGTATDSEFSFSGIGIDQDEGRTLSIINCWIHDNNGGGGVVCGIESNCLIKQSLLERNLGGGASSGYEGTLSVRESVVRDNTASCGGGLGKGNNDSALYVSDSAIYGNTATKGGGICIDACYLADIANTTISGNMATSEGGGLYVVAGCGGDFDLHNTTIADNVAGADGGGIFVEFSPDGGRVIAGTTIIADNHLGSGAASDCAGTQGIESEGYNLVEAVGAGCSITGNLTGNLLGIDPLLAALQNGVGFSPTHGLRAGSPAIDAGDPTACSGTDQRGVPRPQGNRCDIGAYESVCASEPRSSGCRTNAGARFGVTDSSTPEKDRLSWKWLNGDATLLGDFGDPATSTEYSLCVHDNSAGEPALVAALRIPPNALWTQSGAARYSYRDRLGAHDGILSAKFKAGIDGQPRLQLKAEGVKLPLPVPFSPFQYFEQDPSVTVQLFTNDGACWTSDFEVPSTSRNSGAGFSAKAP